MLEDVVHGAGTPGRGGAVKGWAQPQLVQHGPRPEGVVLGKAVVLVLEARPRPNVPVGM